MTKFTVKCVDCKAKFEVIISEKENIVCPGCGSKNIDILKEEINETPGCGGCSGCSGCH